MKHKICIGCSIDFNKPKWANGKRWTKMKYCCHKCFLQNHKPWNKGIKSWVKPWLGKKRKDMENENNGAWKGEKAGYRSIHYWVVQRLGKAIECSECSENKKRIHWANTNHKYKRVISHWLQLCAKCHYQYDLAKGLR